mgnify:CR=1 FL=1
MRVEVTAPAPQPIRSKSGRLLHVDLAAEPDFSEIGQVPEPGQELGLIGDEEQAGCSAEVNPP